MKKLFFIILILIAGVSNAQKFAYVDTDYVLANLPEYTGAQKQINDISVKWQKEIEEKLSEVDKMYRDYQVEKILMSEEMRIKKEEEIIKKEKEAKELQKKRFGQDGDLFKKQQELIKPIQDKVYNAIVEIAETKGYAMVFDKSGSTTVLYSQKRYDISNDVIKQLGYEPGMNDDNDDEDEEEISTPNDRKNQK
ncbi:MAG: OmpH family outer membrane protein [Candidatus Competibacteraceae bacterium]|nr:OmpH family outer membrane protein [Candidatus Competibacteraceae bacterium]